MVGDEDAGWTTEDFNALSSAEQDVLSTKTTMTIFRNCCAQYLESDLGIHAGGTGHLDFFSQESADRDAFLAKMRQEGLKSYELTYLLSFFTYLVFGVLPSPSADIRRRTVNLPDMQFITVPIMLMLGFYCGFKKPVQSESWLRAGCIFLLWRICSFQMVGRTSVGKTPITMPSPCSAAHVH